MRKLVKDAQDNVMVLVSPNGFIPDGYTLVAEEEVDAEELNLARVKKMAEVRNKRDALMLSHDRQYLIAIKDNASKANLDSDRSTLLDLPELAQTEVDALTTVEDIQAYDAFSELTLSESYE